jgi:hypothetical protein
MASPNLDEITTTTLRRRSPKIADNVSDNTALLSRLKQKGNIKLISGGRTIVEPLDYAENSTYKRYSGYEVLDISPSDVISAAEFNWKQAAMAVSISGLEMLQNSGSDAVLDLLESRIENAERSLANNFSTDVYSDGTATNQINGLQALIDGTPTTGTVGGINAANFAFWQNQEYDFSDQSESSSSSTIQTAMNTLYLSCARNRDKPDLIVADNTYFRYYWESLQANQRFVNDKMASAGFDNLKFMGADVVFDGGQDGDCPSSTMYFINTNYLKLKTHKDRNFVPLNPDRYATNQDAMVKLIAWAGNLCVSNRALQGVIEE